MRLLPAIKKVKRSVQNLVQTLTAFLTGTISLKYAYYRISSQITFVGKRYIDGVNWKKYILAPEAKAFKCLWSINPYLCRGRLTYHNVLDMKDDVLN